MPTMTRVRNQHSRTRRRKHHSRKHSRKHNSDGGIFICSNPATHDLEFDWKGGDEIFKFDLKNYKERNHQGKEQDLNRKATCTHTMNTQHTSSEQGVDNQVSKTECINKSDDKNDHNCIVNASNNSIASGTNAKNSCDSIASGTNAEKERPLCKEKETVLQNEKERGQLCKEKETVSHKEIERALHNEKERVLNNETVLNKVKERAMHNEKERPLRDEEERERILSDSEDSEDVIRVWV